MRGAIAGLAIALAVGLTGGLVHADQFDDQIRALESSNAAKVSSLNNLQIKASDYQDAIDKLQARINQIEGQILNTQAQQTAVKQKIADAQARLIREKAILGDAIRAMYLDSQTSTLEVLLSSNNLSDFVDQEQYHITVQNKVKSLVDQITVMKQQLKAQNDKLTRLINDQKLQQSQVVGARNQQDQLLAYNQSQQADFNTKIAAANAQIESLQAQQAASYARLTGGNGNSATGSPIIYTNNIQKSCTSSGYDYCKYRLDDYLPDYNVSDPWGLNLARECVHYVANALADRGYYIPYNLFGNGRGYANKWIPTATGAGVASVVSTPGVDDVVYFSDRALPPYGHVAIIDSINSDGTLHVSQMNWYSGQYSTMDLTITSSIEFLRFHK